MASKMHQICIIFLYLFFSWLGGIILSNKEEKGIVMGMDERFSDMEDEEYRARRARKIREMKQKKREQERRRRILQKRILPLAGMVFCIVMLVMMGAKLFHKSPGEERTEQSAEAEADEAGNGTENGIVNRIKDDSVMTGTETASGGSKETANGGSAGMGTANDGSAGMGTTDGGSVGMGTADGGSAGMGTADGGSTGMGTVNGGSTGMDTKAYVAMATQDTVQIGDEIISSHAILIDLDTNTVRAQKGSGTVINPASMTKVLTVLVAAEHITDLDDTFTITNEIIDYCFANDCSNAGFEEGETVTVRDLFYGAILPSGGEAALGLAVYTAGSQEAFVKMMNDKVEELRLSSTAHFTNCVGLYDKAHHCTVYDMAMIMEAAIDNNFCREVMSAHIYTTSKTEEHPDGLELSNWFLRRIEDKDTGGEVVCGKTGYVVQSGNCAVSYARGNDGNGYICVTADANSGWRCIYDHVALYKKFSEDKPAAPKF